MPVNRPEGPRKSIEESGQHSLQVVVHPVNLRLGEDHLDPVDFLVRVLGLDESASAFDRDGVQEFEQVLTG